MLSRRFVLGAVSASALMVGAAEAEAAHAKNVILFITDGCSWGCYDMASHWEFGAARREAYADFPVKLGMTTYPLNLSTRPTGGNTPEVSYDPARAWDTTPNTGSFGGRPSYFNGYDYIKRSFTDSAAAGTALATGQKSYNNSISWSNDPAVTGSPLTPLITDIAKQWGRATGVVSSVPFTHATPAVFGAQNVNRDAYAQIAEQMLRNPNLDLIMGGGDPRYNSNGELRATPNERYMTMMQLNALLANPDGSNTYGRYFISSKEDFEKLADGTLVPASGRLIGLAQTGDTLQANRNRPADPTNVSVENGNASGVPFNTNVPSLLTMTQGAINFLSRDPDGFFLMVEGGAVDWMAHANNTARIIEEQVDFNRSVAWAIEWVETYSSWDETLMIVLTDHGNGMPMGPNSDRIPFEPIEGRGQGVLPGVRWHYGTHTNENTMFFAKGAGAELFYQYVRGTDPGLVTFLNFGDGRYIDNVDVFAVMRDVMVPEPASAALMLFGLGALGLAARRRRETVDA
ncbi:alkaline phosphatase [Elioraea thermophila]|uniref:alkaline phosphatase n=1 Tax=Elioraea thermophila TaxID=2185104 RepID=UPI000DF163F4|nr:alkaline phosphatase [Elioraea thermophila]